MLAADYVVGAGGGEIGNLEAGAVGSLTSPTIAALRGGLAAMAGAIVISAARPAFAAYRRQSADEDQRGAAESVVAISA